MTIVDYPIHPTTTSMQSQETTLDRGTTLCLACSSSLPPNVDNSELFVTKCCRRPICPRCLDSNPRLARYNPCLVCLAAVGVIQASSSATNRTGRKTGPGGSGVQSADLVENLDGGVKDRDVFVLANSDEDSDSDDDMSVDGEEGGRFPRSAAPPPPDVIYATSSLPKTPSPPPVPANTEEPQIAGATSTPLTPIEDEPLAGPDAPVVYRLRRGDTLMGIALRFRLNETELCRLNNLPTTTLSTTPHILHTRTTILLPPTSEIPPEGPGSAEARRVERAEKQFQMVTKETDWRVAKAYVALAQDPPYPPAKEKPENWERRPGGSRQTSIPESDAIEQYFEDAEWEEQERRNRPSPVIQKFPWGSFGQKSEQNQATQRTRQKSSGFKWPWDA